MINLIYQFIRFAGIGFLNTAVDFAVLNLFAVVLGAYTGLAVGVVNTISFTAAVLHSYYWNKYWAFGTQHGETGLAENIRQFAAAAIFGAAIVGLAVLGAGFKYGFVYFAGLILLLAVGELVLWKAFRLKKDPFAQKSGKEMLLFIIISVVGIGINSGIVGGVTGSVPPQFGVNQELWTNLIKVVATGISLIWNFIGYKVFVFKQ